MPKKNCCWMGAKTEISILATENDILHMCRIIQRNPDTTMASGAKVNLIRLKKALVIDKLKRDQHQCDVDKNKENNNA